MNRAGRILVVDDGEGVRQALVEILRWLGYEGGGCGQRCPLLPVIALTGAGREAERKRLANGADEVLKKPFDVCQIRQIREAVGRALKGGDGQPC